MPALSRAPGRFSNPREAAAACARRMLEVLAARLTEAPDAAVAVSGGSTPKLLFEELAAAPFDWRRVHWFFVDERMVPPDDVDSNFRLARVGLFGPARIAAANVHRIEGELGGEDALRRYEEDMRSHFGLKPGGIPVFDIVHLGIGPEGHTASLFPGSPPILDRVGLAKCVTAPKPPPVRVTLLPAPVLAARNVMMLAAGADKREAVERVFGPVRDAVECPAQLVFEALGEVRWFLDAAAFGALAI